MADGRIRTLSERIVYRDEDNPWITLYFNDVEFPGGRIGRYNRIVEKSGRPGVVVIPVSSVGYGLVRLYRYGIDREVWEVPRGYAECAEPADDAARELFEETGYRPVELTLLGKINPNSSVLATEASVFVARCHVDGVPEIQDKDEVSEFRWFSEPELHSMIADGGITDAITLSALYLLLVSERAR